AQVAVIDFVGDAAGGFAAVVLDARPIEVLVGEDAVAAGGHGQVMGLLGGIRHRFAGLGLDKVNRIPPGARMVRVGVRSVIDRLEPPLHALALFLGVDVFVGAGIDAGPDDVRVAVEIKQHHLGSAVPGADRGNALVALGGALQVVGLVVADDRVGEGRAGD